MKENQFKMIPLDLIQEPKKELRSYVERESLEALAVSIKRYGVINPITVKKVGEKYEIIAGHRRYLAAGMAGRAAISSVVLEGSSKDNEALTLEENIQREDINAMDIARYLMYFIREKNCTVTELAGRFNKTTGWVNQMLSLLNVDPIAQNAVESKQIPYASALEIQKVDDPAARETLTRSAAEGGASHRTIVKWVQSYKGEQEFRRKVQNGEYVVPSTSPPEPMKFTCFLCGQKHDNNSMITVRVGSDCYPVLQQLGKIAAKEGLVNTEGKNDGPGENSQTGNNTVLS